MDEVAQADPEQMRSGKSVAAFCREQGLRASHFFPEGIMIYS
jgi:hypothetical protein